MKSNYKKNDKVKLTSKELREFINNVSKYEKEISESHKFLQEGDKVKLDVERITSHPDFNKKVKNYKDFVYSNSDRIFTVKYDKRHKENPVLVCLKEDTEHDWLFHEIDLIKIKE